MDLRIPEVKALQTKSLQVVSYLLLSCCGLLAQHEGHYANPILAGFYPDPSICRVDGDYYLVASSFSYFPGIPIFHSKDLTNWRQIGHVLDRPEQLNLDGLGVSRGIFAPSIRHHDGVFYVTSTLVDAGGNFVVTAKNPAGPWSNPAWIPEINGIDPSMFFHENGKAYILYNSVPPDDKPLYDGHRTIRMYEFDLTQLKVGGEEQILVNGGTDITKKPVWIEAPHIFQKDVYYYLMAAEGGTGDQHSEVVFRSTQVQGPYVPYEGNPILTQRHLDPKRAFPITSTGHADFVQTVAGDWWAVFLGCRPYRPFEGGFYNTGRETFLAPVEWQDGWPVINPDYKQVRYSYPHPIPPVKGFSDIPYSGNFTHRDHFDRDELHPSWSFLRTPRDKWYDLNSRRGLLTLQVRPESCADSVNASFIGRRQQHLRGSASISLAFVPGSENEKAGLLIFQNEKHFYFLCKSLQGTEPVVQLYKSGARDMEVLASHTVPVGQADKPIYLKIDADGSHYSFSFGYRPDNWKLLKRDVGAKFLSTKVAGGFVGCMYAMYATSLGQSSQNVAHFDWFEYRGDDEVYK